MRSELIPPIEFFKKMKKKPALQAILDSFNNYTTEALENIKGQPLWIRKILVELKDKELYGEANRIAEENAIKIAEENAIQIAAQMMKNDSVTPNTKFEIREWVGGDWFMPCGKTGGMSIEVTYGDYLLVYNHAQHFVGLSSSMGVQTDSNWNRILHNTKPIGMMTKLEYSRFVSDKLGKIYVDREEKAKIAGPNSYVEPRTDGGFTITSHGTYK